MRNQEIFVDSARWRKSGVKSVVFIMYPFLSFNNFFYEIVCTYLKIGIIVMEIL